ncbi:MAG TPA: hypothetical protein VK904_00775 [Miltoncostaeaceae bacterium]|nr:hypothetical protein [Miltoncostaeaceae bacterium]
MGPTTAGGHVQKRRERPEERDSEREEVEVDAGAEPGRLLGTPPPGTVPGGQEAGRLTGAQPADPDEAEG